MAEIRIWDFIFPVRQEALAGDIAVSGKRQGWILRDMDSTYGTFINGSQKLMPNVDYTLHSGDMIYLAGKENAFRVSIK